MNQKEAYLIVEFFINQTGNSDHYDLNGLRVKSQVFDILIPIIGILIICLNLIVVVVISSGLVLRTTFEPRTTYIFICNVSLADLLLGNTIMIAEYLPKEEISIPICAMILVFIVSTNMISAWSVALIAFDRFLYIVYGMKYKLWMYPSRAYLLCFLTWILGITLGILPSAFTYRIMDDGPPALCNYIYGISAEFELFLIFCGLFPIVSMICLYLCILGKALKKVKQLRKTKKFNSSQEDDFRMHYVTNQNLSAMEPSKMKAIKVVLCTTSAICITWLPYIIWCGIYADHPENLEIKVLRYSIGSSLAVILCFNSIFNPLIYAWWNNGFRGFLFKSLVKTTNKNLITISTTKL